MINPRTTVAGLIAALIPWVKGLGILPDGVIDAIQTIAIALLGYFAADKA